MDCTFNFSTTIQLYRVQVLGVSLVAFDTICVSLLGNRHSLCFHIRDGSLKKLRIPSVPIVRRHESAL